jgi:CheY-like chemotaxis protein
MFAATSRIDHVGTSLETASPEQGDRFDEHDCVSWLGVAIAPQRVLLVEDSAVVQAVVRQALRRGGCELVWARDGVAALTSLQDGADPDLILLDINLPRMNGLELLGELRAAGTLARVPVIIISTEGEDHDIARGLEAGARAYLRKPFRAQQLWEAISAVMAP